MFRGDITNMVDCALKIGCYYLLRLHMIMLTIVFCFVVGPFVSLVVVFCEF